MPARIKKEKGPQKGNQNARTHGFYSKVLDEAEKIDFEIAAGVEGIDDEIAMLRVKIKSVLERDPENINSTSKGVINDFTSAGTDWPDGVFRSVSFYNL